MQAKASGARRQSRTWRSCLVVMMVGALMGCAGDEVPGEELATVAQAAASGCGYLRSGEVLWRGESVKSCNGKAQLSHQTDGNVVEYDPAGALWWTGTNNPATHRLIMQTDGNLVLYDTSNRPLWYTGTSGNPGAYLGVQDDCNLVVYSAGGRVLWTNNKQCRNTSPGVVDVLTYMTSGCGAAGPQYSTQKAARWYVPMGKDSSGRKQFVYVKGHNGKDYESYTADESWIRLWKDTSWAYFDDGLQTYCDEQCGALNQPTSCRHQWRGDSVPAGYAYQAPKDSTDWGGAKVMPRYFDTARGVQTYTFGIYVDAQSENTCGACDSWHEGSTFQKYTVEYLPSVTAPNGVQYTNVLKKVIIDGAGKNEVYFFAQGKGWVGYEVQGSSYKDWINGSTTGISYPSICSSGGAVSHC